MTDNYLWNLIMFIVLVVKDNHTIVLLLSKLFFAGPAVPEWARADRHLFPAKKNLDKSKTII